MKVILLADVKGIGKKGEVVNASDGHARNYLLPKKLAIQADKQNMNELSAKKQSESHKKELEKKEAIRVKEKLEKETLTLKVKAGETGKTFGTITSKEIADEIEKDFKEKVDKKKIVIKEPIKQIGTHIVELKLFEGVICKLKINVKGE